ncbi:MAG: hypothetical protein KAI53_06000 [Candidatus Aenigmarchaeota archaeon]|nr:hypothetical protein [Candidatus Aenigmarchaeota archaeon]
MRKNGECTESALQREFKQGYCADVLSYELLGKRMIIRVTNGVKAIWQISDYKVLVDRTCVENGESDKFDCVGFSTLEKIPHPRYSELDGCLKKYGDKLMA